MPVYQISEHFGWKVRQRMLVGAPDQEKALRAIMEPPFERMPPEARNWLFIDDTLGGGGLIDPKDPDHFFRADPREEDDDENGV